MKSGEHFIAGSISGMAGTIIGHPFDTIKVKLQTGGNIGISGLFKGVSFPLVGEMVNTAVVFGVYNSVGSGFVAGGLSACLMCPIEAFKIKKQLGIKVGKELYKGLLATILRDAPFYAVYFTTYEQLYDKGGFIAGGIAGTLGWTSIYPIDVIKTKIQTTTEPMSITTAIKSIYKTSGTKGFFRGYFPTIFRAFPVNAVSFFVYEHVLKLINKSI